jgi:hypothetical protein
MSQQPEKERATQNKTQRQRKGIKTGHRRTFHNAGDKIYISNCELHLCVLPCADADAPLRRRDGVRRWPHSLSLSLISAYTQRPVGDNNIYNFSSRARVMLLISSCATSPPCHRHRRSLPLSPFLSLSALCSFLSRRSFALLCYCLRCKRSSAAAAANIIRRGVAMLVTLGSS